MFRRIRVTGIALLVVAGPMACATGSTWKSGVGERMLGQTPWVSGTAAPADSLRVGIVPIRWQRDASPSQLREPRSNAGSPVDSLLDAMNATLRQHTGERMVWIAPIEGPGVTAPDVQFGCPRDGLECDPEVQRQLFGSRSARMRLAVGRPSRGWTQQAAGRLDAAGVSEMIVLTVEVGDYVAAQSSPLGGKRVVLGPGHTELLSWLTSVNTPVSVVQVTGALMARDGRARRIAAEGIMARTPGGVLSALGIQSNISDRDVQTLRTLVRDDLPGRPLAWEVALRNVVTELVGRSAWRATP